MLIQALQKQVDNCATKESVDSLAKRFDATTSDLVRRIEEITTVRIEQLAKEQETLLKQNNQRAQDSLKRIVAVQATILLTALTTIIGLLANFFFKFIK